MLRMMIVHNHSDLKHLPPETVWFIRNDIDMARAMHEKDVRLSLGRFEGEIPTATLVELYQQDEKNHHYYFESLWKASKTREQAIVDYYRSVSADVQRSFINATVVDL